MQNDVFKIIYSQKFRKYSLLKYLVLIEQDKPQITPF